MAVVGKGDLASVLPDRDDLLFFASGVSNSQETRPSEYQRELDLLLEQDREAHIVYFGSLAVFYAHTLYTQHKLFMERVVKEEFKKNTIMRLGNITFGNNPHTLINYLKAHPDAEIRDEYRYITDEEELLHWIDLIPAWPAEMNITGERLKIKEIYDKHVVPHTREI